MQFSRQGVEGKAFIWGNFLGNISIEVGKGAHLEVIHKLITVQCNCDYILLEL